jgi:hypothetical protein
MIYEIFKRPQAERDIEECFVYIAEDNVDAGVVFLVAVEDSLEQLAASLFSEKPERFKTNNFKTFGCGK